MKNQYGRPWIDLRKLRKERGWTQAVAANQLGVTREHVSAIENGKRGISMKMMSAIIQVFGMAYKDFFQSPTH
ncbi:MAG: helix-turn-helix transcriptional regulator [Deltaproteobacteria bacterium]|jgi:DNA-binding XRE family transcriptional regulator|nr:helix-turn-helix transcriptional regulator [Deltaproteobacteria bacterium]